MRNQKCAVGRLPKGYYWPWEVPVQPTRKTTHPMDGFGNHSCVGSGLPNLRNGLSGNAGCGDSHLGYLKLG